MSESILRRKLVVLGLGLGTLVVVGGFLAVGIGEAREAAFATSCVHNAKLFGVPLRVYAEDHENRFPEKLSELYPEYMTELLHLICPNLREHYKEMTGAEYPFSEPPTAEEIDTLCSYTYVPGYGLDDDKDIVVVYEKEDNHYGKGRALLYLDGRALRKLPEDWPSGPSEE